MSAGLSRRPLIPQSDRTVGAAVSSATSFETEVRGLSSIEWKRRLWHMLPGLLPFLLWAVPHRDPISPTLYAVILGITVFIASRIYIHFQQIRRDGEATTARAGAVLGYSVSVLLTFLVFPAHAELGFAVLAIVAFGDGSATLGGLLLGGRRLPWNEQKSWSGLMCFLLVGLPMAAVIYWGETHNLEALTPGIPMPLAFVCVAPAVILAAIAESLRSNVNDNLRVGLTAAVVLALTHGLVIGF